MQRMSELAITPDIRGRKVQVAGKPDWGVGVVQIVQPATINGGAAHRLTIDFPVVGRKILLAPPARLIEPDAGPSREQGWLDQIGGRTLDDRLRKLPDEIGNFLGTPREKLRAVLPLYLYHDGPQTLLRWARWRSGAADPLTLWNRDELHTSFVAFCQDRDSFLRTQAAQLQAKEGREALVAWIAALDDDVREEVLAALRRPI